MVVIVNKFPSTSETIYEHVFKIHITNHVVVIETMAQEDSIVYPFSKTDATTFIVMTNGDYALRGE